MKTPDRVMCARLEAANRREPGKRVTWWGLLPKPHYVIHVREAYPDAHKSRRGYLWWRIEYEVGRYTGWWRTPARAFERIRLKLARVTWITAGK